MCWKLISHAHITRRADDQSQLHSFANGITRDQQAVTAGLPSAACHGSPVGRAELADVAADGLHPAGPALGVQDGGVMPMRALSSSSVIRAPGKRIRASALSRCRHGVFVRRSLPASRWNRAIKARANTRHGALLPVFLSHPATDRLFMISVRARQGRVSAQTLQFWRCLVTGRGSIQQ